MRAKKELTLYSPSGQKNAGALVVNMTGDVRRVAKSPPVPREEVSLIRQTKYADSSHSNTRPSHSNKRTQGRPWARTLLHCETHLCKGIVKSYPTPALHGLAPFPPHLVPKAPQKHLISKVSKPFGQSWPNPWLHPLGGKSFRSASRCGESCGESCGGRVGESPTCSRRALRPSSGTVALDGQSGKLI